MAIGIIAPPYICYNDPVAEPRRHNNHLSVLNNHALQRTYIWVVMHMLAYIAPPWDYDALMNHSNWLGRSCKRNQGSYCQLDTLQWFKKYHHIFGYMSSRNLNSTSFSKRFICHFNLGSIFIRCGSDTDCCYFCTIQIVILSNDIRIIPICSTLLIRIVILCHLRKQTLC